MVQWLEHKDADPEVRGSNLTGRGLIIWMIEIKYLLKFLALPKKIMWRETRFLPDMWLQTG